MLDFRDRLVYVLELYWPELRSVIDPLKKQRLRDLLRGLSSPENGPDVQPYAKHLEEHFDVLCTFVGGDRFRNDPRRIADALAGVPGVGFWRSLKVCGQSPCVMQVGQRALGAYIQRKLPRLWQVIQTADKVKVAVALRGFRTKDRHLKWLWEPEGALVALAVLEASKPDFSRIMRQA